MFIFRLLCFVSVLFIGVGYTANMPKHTHGTTHLSISVDKKNVEIEFLIPGMTLVGFENKAKTRVHKQMLADVEHVWNKEWNKLFWLRPDLRCQNEKFKYETIVSEGSHIDHLISLKLVCHKELEGSRAQLNILAFYPRIKNIILKIVRSEKKGSQAIIKSKNFKFIL